MSSRGFGAAVVGRLNFKSPERSRGILSAGFALLRESLLLLVQKKKPRKRHPSSAPASPVHSGAHVEAMRSGTRAALAALRHADRTGAVRRTRLDAARLRRLTMGSEYSAGLMFSLRRIKVLRGFWPKPTQALPNCRTVSVFGCPSGPAQTLGASGCPAHGAGTASMSERGQSRASFWPCPSRPGRLREPAKRADMQGVLSFGYFRLDKQTKVTRTAVRNRH